MNQPPGGPPPGFPPQPAHPQHPQGQQQAHPQQQHAHPGQQAHPQQQHPGQPMAQPGQHPQPQQQQPGNAPFAGMGGAAGVDRKAQVQGFARSLLDFSFAREALISPRVLKVLYGIWLFMLVPSVLMLLFFWYQALTHESWATGEWDPQFVPFMVSIVAWPLMAAVWILMGRVLFERGILAFRNHDVLCEMRDALRDQG